MDEAMREQVLQNGPVGRWQSFAGTASILMCDTWCFRPDGQGQVTYSSVLSGERSESFRWRMAGPALLELRMTGDDPDDVERLSLAFIAVTSDTGTAICLTQAGLDTFRSGPGPLVRCQAPA